MNKQNFKWELDYEGYWQYPTCDKPLKGILSLKDGNLTLKISSRLQIETKLQIPSILGKVKDKRGSDHLYIKLLNLKETQIKISLGRKDNVYTYNATDVLISNHKESFTSTIQAVSINSFLLSMWTNRNNLNSLNCTFEGGKIIITHNTNNNIDCKYYGFHQEGSSSIPMPLCYSVGLPKKCFLEIQFTNKRNYFFDAQKHARRFFNLFILLSQAPIDIGYSFYETDNGFFAHWNCLRHRYFLLEKPFGVACNFQSINLELLTNLVKNWETIYLEYTKSIDVFFDLFECEKIPVEQRIKTCMSVIDGLTHNKRPSGDGQTKDIKKKTEFIKILDKIKSSKCLSGKEYNLLKRKLFRESSISLGNRFCLLLNSLKDVLPKNLNDEFAFKCTKTRNKLTHVESDQTDVFSPYEYSTVVHELETIISTYLLNKIGADNDFICRTLHLSSKKQIQKGYIENSLTLRTLKTNCF